MFNLCTFLFGENNNVKSKKFYIRRNNSEVDSVETGRIVIAHLFILSDLEKCMYGTFL